LPKIVWQKSQLKNVESKQTVEVATDPPQHTDVPKNEESDAKAFMQSVMQGVPVDKYEGRKKLAQQAKQLGVKQFSSNKKTHRKIWHRIVTRSSLVRGNKNCLLYDQ